MGRMRSQSDALRQVDIGRLGRVRLELELGGREEHKVLADRQGIRCDDEFRDARAESVEILGGLENDELSEGVDVPIGKQVGLRQRQDPDPGELDERAIVGE
jgi:hypothetical protein